MNSQWSLSTEGLPPLWALAGFVALAALSVWAYRRCAPGVSGWRRGLLLGLRIGIIGVFALLVVRPVLDLTRREPLRQRLPVLLDISQSMQLKDRRDQPNDLKRAALAAGLIEPESFANAAPANAKVEVGLISRWELLQKLAGNGRLDLWRRLQALADLAFYPFGREAAAADFPGARDSLPTVDPESTMEFFKSLHPDRNATAIGDSIRQVLQENRGQPIGGLLLITDGQNNAGSPPVEAARYAGDQNVPLYIYGVGVTAAPDVILEGVRTQKLAFVQERVEVHAKVRVQGLRDKTVAATLLVNGVAEDQQSLAVGDEGEYDLSLHFVPAQAGDAQLDVTLAPLPEEIDKTNNAGSAHLRVTDSKFHVLLLEQEPRWDFRYLLAYLQRDRRLEVRAVMINGEPGLEEGADSPFLPGLPDDRDVFFKSEVLILGDVNPDDLGSERMGIIREWVEAGGGIIFLAGSNFNPTAYAGTPLEALLPVVPDREAVDAAVRAPEPFKLQLTPEGETSPYLQMDPDPAENRRVWDGFPGVRWTAPALRAKPGAQTLLTDPRPERSGRYGAPPVFAIQSYGAGTCVYLGIEETYRWRSRVGEKYYSILWGQIMQSLALQLLEGGSAHTQLRTDRPQYAVGDTVTVAGRAYREHFQPLLAPTLEGTLTVESPDAAGKTTSRKQALNLAADPDGQGFHGGFVATVPGQYEYSTTRDPEAVLRFEVVEPRSERLQTALNERLLKTMADVSGGHFFREEDLDQLPRFLREKTVSVESTRRLRPYYSPWCLAALLAFAFAEWLLRRLNQLK